jgi:hypothetical protein
VGCQGGGERRGRRRILTRRTAGGRTSLGNDLSPTARSYCLTARLWSTRFVPGILRRKKKKVRANSMFRFSYTYTFKFKKVIIPFPSIPFESRTHILTGPDKGDGLV